MSESKTASRRLFAAVFPPAAALRELEAQLQAPRSAAKPADLRWIAGQSLHLTLQFFGSVPLGRVEALAGACAQAALSCGPFVLRLSGAGAFPSPRRARVLWVSVVEGGTELCHLAETLERAVAPLGWPRDAAGFTPHLSVARSSSPFDAAPLMAAVGAVDVRLPVTGLALVRSQLGSPAVRYEVLQEFALT